MSNSLWPDPAIGVFETLLVLDRSPIEFDAHLARLRASVRELFDSEIPQNGRRLALDGAADLTLGRLRLTVAPDARGALAADVVTAKVDPLNVFPAWERAIALRPFVIRGGLGAHKWADREGLAWTESSEPDGSLPLLLDSEAEVLEASRANLFAIDGDVVITPAADGRILPGVARARAIEAARSLGIDVRERALSVEQLLAAGEAFLTGSVRGVEPVRSVGDTELRTPGRVSCAIAGEMKRLWLGERAVQSLAAP